MRRLRGVVHYDALGVDEMRQEKLGQFKLWKHIKLKHVSEVSGRGVCKGHDVVAARVVEGDVERRDTGAQGVD
jgi:hypothetical protein